MIPSLFVIQLLIYIPKWPHLLPNLFLQSTSYYDSKTPYLTKYGSVQISSKIVLVKDPVNIRPYAFGVFTTAMSYTNAIAITWTTLILLY